MSEYARQYPCKLTQSSLPDYHLRSLLKLLDENQYRLFGSPSDASVNFCELDVDGKGKTFPPLVRCVESVRPSLNGTYL